MAGAHAAGLAALLLSVNPNLTPAQVKSTILSTATDMGVRARTTDRLWADQRAGGGGRGVPGGRGHADDESDGDPGADLNGNGLVDLGIRCATWSPWRIPGACAAQQCGGQRHRAGLHELRGDRAAPVERHPRARRPTPRTALPLDEGGLNIGSVPAQSSSTVSFDDGGSAAAGGCMRWSARRRCGPGPARRPSRWSRRSRGRFCRRLWSRPAPDQPNLNLYLHLRLSGRRIADSVVVTAAMPRRHNAMWRAAPTRAGRW